MNRSWLNVKTTVGFGILWNCLVLTAQKEPRTYIANNTDEAIVIDGVSDESSWQKADWSQEFIDIEGVKKPTYETKMKMLWDDTYLYFFAQMKEPHVWATLKQRDTVIFYNNDFEIFLDPDGDTYDYMEFEINALNTVWDLFLTKPYRDGPKVIDGWDIKGLKTAVQVDGTLNDPTDTDKGWSVEIAMPWAALSEANVHGDVPKDEFWRINFSRVNWDFDLNAGRYSRKKDKNGKYLPEYNWVWSPQGVINMHEPEHWGYVYFSTAKVGGEKEFIIPKDEHIKWYLYELYRSLKKQQDGKLELKKGGYGIFGKPINPALEEHTRGWNVSVKSPFSGKLLLVRDNGKFEAYEHGK